MDGQGPLVFRVGSLIYIYHVVEVRGPMDKPMIVCGITGMNQIQRSQPCVSGTGRFSDQVARRGSALCRGARRR